MSTLAIVTVCRNDRAGLERTLTSLNEQSWQGFAHHVVDGASSDGSAELIREQGTRFTTWVSEPDDGVYDAQNKGWRSASAEFVLFLNSGDTLSAPDVLVRALPSLSAAVDIAYGDAYLSDDRGPYATKRHPFPIRSPWLMKEVVAHQSQFIRRSLLERMGGYDTQYRIAADYALFAQAFWQGGLRLVKLPFVVGVFDTRGLSSRTDQVERFAWERKDIQRRFAPRFWYMAYHGWAAFNRMIGR
ncbi:MAG: glycosyltransferase [Flavobacteriales bacterium]|nr:glycosyltransferase [Flavobacteriales bacterium]